MLLPQLIERSVVGNPMVAGLFLLELLQRRLPGLAVLIVPMDNIHLLLSHRLRTTSRSRLTAVASGKGTRYSTQGFTIDRVGLWKPSRRTHLHTVSVDRPRHPH